MSVPSLRARLANLAARVLVKRVTNAASFDLARVRRAMASRLTMPAALPRGLRVEASHEPGLPGEWLYPRDAFDGVALLFIHGGGFIAGSPRTHRSFAGWVANESRVPVFSLSYRLAPEHPYPAALDDCVAAVRALRARGLRVAVGGDSAGGQLAIATALRLREAAEEQPAGLMLVCPMTDFTDASESLRTNAESEPLLGLRHREHALGLYAGATSRRDPLLSPVYADLRGLAPMIVEASRIEVLWDDARRFVEAAQAAGVAVEFHPHDGLAHDWQLMVPFTPEANASVRRLAAWVSARLRGG
ncbi:MAG TPA: alpha/beta hydrolase [Gemmatimonadaceae bacterium]|nr:alpha/beta hydrolase [Gemmatimonadaceae bacterium]